MPEEKSEQGSDKSQQEIADLKHKVVALAKESARYRTARNAALRESHALRQIAKSHSVNVDEHLTVEKLDALKIVDGAVQGDFTYSAPSLKQAKEQAQTKTTQKSEEKSVGLTEESIAAMSHDEINKNWDAIQKFMQQST